MIITASKSFTNEAIQFEIKISCKYRGFINMHLVISCNCDRQNYFSQIHEQNAGMTQQWAYSAQRASTKIIYMFVNRQHYHEMISII